MKRMMVIVTILLLALGLIAATGVSAQTAYDSTINIRNMDPTEASVVIQFFATDGSHDPSADVVMNIPGESMAYYFVLLNTNLPVDFQGSAVVASDKELVIVHNLRINQGEQGASTNGFAEGSPVVQLPLLMRNNGGYTTWFSVQNAGMADAIVEVEFFPGSIAGKKWQWVNPADSSNQVAIAPGAAYYFDQADMPEIGTGATGRFIGSAVVTSVNGEPLVASAIQVGPFGLYAYDGFGSSGSQSVLAPLFIYHHVGIQSSIQVQNVGTMTTTVTMSYAPGAYGNACTETHTIAAGASEVFGFLSFYGPTAYSDCYTQNPGTRFIGSAYVSTNSSSQPLLGVVNQMNGTTTKSGSYNAFAPEEATSCVAAPIVMDSNSNYWTSLNIMNVGAAATTVTVEYSMYQGHQPANDVLVLSPNEMGDILHANKLGVTPGARYIGSALACGTPGSKIVGVVNQINTVAAGDTLFVYNGFNIAD
jgi:hypothetical protein